jgi:pimeloyl-ACP methyl ester carboxylesterase
VLTGSAGLGEQSLVGSLVSLRLSSPRRADYEGVRRVIATAFRNPVHATKDLVDEVYRVFNDEPSHATNVLSLVRSVTRAPLADVLPHVRQPVCLIWGRQDVITPPAIARDFQRRLANADLFWIDECGHAPMIEQPDAFNRVLENWLAAQRSG